MLKWANELMVFAGVTQLVQFRPLEAFGQRCLSLWCGHCMRLICVFLELVAKRIVR
ncbi:hypothetical protein O9992_05040 [Vibrio lentus]|nr:hypothetical protein [Vibrio lentus]